LTVGGGAGVSAVEARIPYPAGLVAADTTKIPSLQVGGLLVSNTSTTLFENYSLVEPSVGYFTIGRNGPTSTGALTKSTGNIFNNGDTISFSFTVPIAGWSSLPTTLLLPVSKTNEFSAYISGSTFSRVGATWLSSAASSGTNNQTKTATVLAGVFSVVPNCQCNGNEVPSGLDVTCRFDSANSTNTNLIFSTTVNGSAANQNITIACQKQSPDYTPQGVLPVNITPDTFVQTAGVINPVHFSVSFGTTNATSPCIASPCSYLDQIGNYVTSITGTGSPYTVNFSKTFSKVKCLLNANESVATVDLSSTYLSCSNCNSLTMQGMRTSSLTTQQIYGTLMCDAIP
jgi:hypothetical protein